MSGSNSLFDNYRRQPVAFVEGRGATLWDDQGREYLDFLGGIAVSSLGHTHPRLTASLHQQLDRLLHVSNLYRIPEQERAAELLAEVCGLPKVFFCNSGTEANEAILKMARSYAQDHGLPPKLLVAENGFHGRTFGALSATGTPSYRQGFGEMLPGFEFVPYNDLPKALLALEECAGVLLEPVQGEGGVLPAESDFLLGLAAACRQQGKLFLLDEVQTGIGRTGSWLAAHQYGVTPDAVSLAKGLGGGIPVGAVLATEKLSSQLGPGRHGTTFGGNPLAATAVLAVLESIEEEGLLEKIRDSGRYLKQRLEELPGVTQVRGMGLMLGAETELPAAEVAQRCLESGLLLNAVRPHTVRLLPPYVVSRQEIDRATGILGEALCPQSVKENVASVPS